MASLSDILTAAKNVVTAINGAAQAYTSVQGTQNSGNLTAATLVYLGPTRICTVSVTTAGSSVGNIYDAFLAGATTNLLYVIPNTIGVYVVNMPVSSGLAVSPGSGQAVVVSYS